VIVFLGQCGGQFIEFRMMVVLDHHAVSLVELGVEAELGSRWSVELGIISTRVGGDNGLEAMKPCKPTKTTSQRLNINIP
jgi:hypothetical protein